MKITTVIVMRHRRGVQGLKVALGFSASDHPLGAGVTKGFYTDESGIARVEHEKAGPATLFIDGKKIKEVEAGKNYAIVVELDKL